MALLDILHRGSSHVREASSIHWPQFFRLASQADRSGLTQLLEAYPNIQVHDALKSQLDELIKTLYPSVRFTAEQLAARVREHVEDTSLAEYGVWVYYPWSSRLVHILDEKEYTRLRTSRNRYKITSEEQDSLAHRKIGVIGLSVGQSVAVTMAMERIFGEIRLADFDSLELTNLNRIRTGIHNLGVPKVLLAAREIAEIDPFLKVVCYPEGLTEENMDSFFLKGGKLDLLVEECDGVDIKITSRLKARELGIPVVMEASDRSTLDVERFDLEPTRSILHGLIDHLDVSKLKNLKTSEEKVPYMLPMVGLETSSPRLKASLLEIEQSINTWPQLASAVALGGGVVTDVVRRILLDQFQESGRYFVDVEELVGNKKSPVSSTQAGSQTLGEQPFTRTQMAQIAAQVLPNDGLESLLLSKEQISQLVELAAKAPSAGNHQPWQWYYSQGELFLYQDPSHQYRLGDANNLSIYSALGAAVENLVLAAQQSGYSVKSTLFPVPAEPRLIGTFRFFAAETSGLDPEPTVPPDLFPFIATRYTNRKNSERLPIGTRELNALRQAAATVPGVSLDFISDPACLKSIGEIIAGAERLRLMHPEGHREVFEKEVRWNQTQVLETRDGIDISSFGLTPTEEAGFQVAKDPQVMALLNHWQKGTGFEKLGRKAVTSASAVGLLTIPSFAPKHFVIGGRGLQRVWLTATQLGLAIQPLTAPVYLFAHLLHNNGRLFSSDDADKLRHWRTEFEQLFPVLQNKVDLFLFRLTLGDQSSTKSLRRPLESILYFDK